MSKLLMLMALVGALSFGCGGGGSDTPAEDAAESVGDALEEAGEAIDDAMDDAGDAVEDAVEDASESVPASMPAE